MFEECKTLRELNAMRIQLSKDNDIVLVNNAYNAARVRILTSQTNFVKINPVYVTIEDPVKYSGVPVAGRCDERNTIRLTKEGFLY